MFAEYSELSPEEIAELVKEVTILRSVRHPNLVLYMGSNLHSDPMFLVTEYCEGGSLSQVIKKMPEMPLLTKIDLSIQVVSAMTYLHSCEPSIVHRDLKPGNVLLDKTKTVAKVCDFGM